MFETIVEPVLFRLEADQYTSRFAMARDDDLLRLSLAQIAGQIVLDFRKRDLFHSGFPNCANHDSASNLGTIAKISTAVPDTSQNTRTSSTRSLYRGWRNPRNRLIRLRLAFSGWCLKCVSIAVITMARTCALIFFRSSTACGARMMSKGIL